MALCTVVQVLEEVSTMLMLLLLSLLQPKLLKYSIEEDWEVGRGGEEEGHHQVQDEEGGRHSFLFRGLLI